MSTFPLKGLEPDGGRGAGHKEEELRSTTLSAQQEAWLDGHPDPARRAHAHGRILNHEVLAALEFIAADTSAVEAPVPVCEDATDSIRASMAWFPGSAQGAQQPREPKELRAELDALARLRSQFKGPPLTSEEIIAATSRDIHPPELDRFGDRINLQS